jgi:1-deoxy-D-xylulose-5-phosphate synthase
LTWGLPSSTPLPFLPEWQRRNGGFCNIYSLFYKGIRPSDSRRRPTKLTGYFCLDRAGLVERRRTTHHGVFDLAYLRCIPNMIIYSHWTKLDCKHTVYCPMEATLSNTLPSWSWRSRRLAIKNFGNYEKIEIGRATYLKHGTETAVLSNGPIGKMSLWH